MDVFCANTATGIANSRDKLRSLQILSRFDIGIPPTEFVRDKDDVLPAIERVGGAPVIIKLLEGTQGVGVILAESVKMAQAIIETLQSTKQNVLVQKFVNESRGRDIRAFVIGDRVVAAMRRVAQGDEFRSNVHRGGRTELVQIDAELERLALQATQIMGLRVAGVDLIESAHGPLVLEVNSSPGLEGIEAATGVDVASEIVRCLEEQRAFPDVDLRQRLSVTATHGVVEFRVGSGSELAERTLGRLELAQRDVQVLTVFRGASALPNPAANFVLLPGDRVLCFGRFDVLRDLLGTSHEAR